MSELKKTGYTGVHIADAQERQLELDSGKKDDPELPQFSRDVPVSSRRTVHGGNVTLEYRWKANQNENIHIREITFRDSEQLDGLFRVDARDGIDAVPVINGNAVLILRKTTKEIAKALYNSYSTVQGGLENVAGWLATVLGNIYIVSKVERMCWSFDKRLVRNNHLKRIDCDDLDSGQKKKLCDMLIQNLAGLHSRGLVLGRFTMNSVLLKNDGMQFTDLRGLRATRKLSFGVEEFKAMMQYLFALGLMKPEDCYYSVALYHAGNEQGCSQWYREKTGKKADPLEIAQTLEQEIL